MRWLKNIKDKEFWEQLGGDDNAEVDTDQQTAIDDRGGALLVSAAAGSGKTAVLTERVLRRLTDENDPVDIDACCWLPLPAQRQPKCVSESVRPLVRL